MAVKPRLRRAPKLRNSLAALTLWLLASISHAADAEYQLIGKPAAGQLSHVKTTLEAEGQLKFTVDGKVTFVPLTVSGTLVYDEKLFAAGTAPQEALRAVRRYRQAEATVNLDGKTLPARKLPTDRALIAAVVGEGELTLFSPTGPLTRDELELLTPPADPLTLNELLPDARVKKGDSWKHSPETMSRVLNLDEVSLCDLRSTLAEVADGRAKVELGGTVHGGVNGIETEIELKARYHYDFKLGRLVWFAAQLKEKRPIGHVGPGIEATSLVETDLRPWADAADLSDEKLAGLPLEATPATTALVHTAAGGEFSLTYDRRWHLITDERNVSVLRLIDRGEFVGQVNISPLPAKKPGTSVTLTELQGDIERNLGKAFGQFVKAGQYADERDHRVLRVEAIGKTGDLNIRWIYYYVADEQGHNVALAFTMEETLVEKFGKADEPIVAGLRLLQPVRTSGKKATARAQ